MILIARIGGPAGIEMVCDTDDTDTTPTPEWCEDMVHRLARQALETYDALPDSRLSPPVEAVEEPDE